MDGKGGGVGGIVDAAEGINLFQYEKGSSRGVSGDEIPTHVHVIHLCLGVMGKGEVETAIKHELNDGVRCLRREGDDIACAPRRRRGKWMGIKEEERGTSYRTPVHVEIIAREDGGHAAPVVGKGDILIAHGSDRLGN
ncbi:hypothetical protein A3I42_04885 [Candidatus Uhrbacteria bacterium RIFCSPLOWO2_02_FULL_49_11]|uniref:Uncharacterized protein n=1 Tax=Candidatus Uhrbacteria bacterium RIFCSPLOWO2_02_FULL_49_11 TaxID=1802409 RepID=A0A1F7VBC0_9BACT|nr:MAG: hypothetical protein A3I42_04885 [Candidatus Uhrbacteria bacterium RIFCSPLOWO2_02_FULL_49_11]